MWWHLLISHALAAVLIVVLTEVEIRYNLNRIADNGSKDSLRDTFHRQRGTLRALAVLLIMAAAAWPAWGHWKAYAQSMGAVLFWTIGWFPFRFNTGLNTGRGLDKYYVSFTTWASKWDKWFVKQATYIKLKGLTEDRKQIVWYALAICSHKWVLIGLLIFGAYQFLNLTLHAILSL